MHQAKSLKVSTSNSGTVLYKALVNSSMTDNSGIFAFDTDFEDEGKRSILEVFVKFHSDGTHFYYCVIGDKKEFVFAKGSDGVWVDMKVGKTDLAERVGRIIDEELAVGKKSNQRS